MMFIAFLWAHSGEVYLNNFMHRKAELGRTLGSGAAGRWMELWEWCSRRGPGGYFWDAWAAHSSILLDLLGPQSAPCWTLCCACTAIWLQMDKKRGISRRLIKRFLETLWWDSKGSYSAWISPELFGMLQVIDSLIYLVLKLNWVLWSN